jgi:cell division protein FtsA
LILKGYDDYEHKRKQFDQTYFKVDVPQGLKNTTDEAPGTDIITAPPLTTSATRRGMSSFWGKFKNSLIDIFKEEEDRHL